MATFEEIYAEFGAVLLDEIGVDATFIPNSGPPVACRVYFSWEDESQPGGLESSGLSKVKTVHYLQSEVGKLVSRGERFSISGVTYRAKANAELPDIDGVVKVFVK